MSFLNKIIVVHKDRLNVSKELNLLKEIFPDYKIESFSFTGFKKEHLHEQRLVITLGGDGTFVKAANLIKKGDIIGINLAPKTSEGALTTLSINEIDLLRNIDFDTVRRLNRQRLKATLNGKVIAEHAINEVYVGTLQQFHTSRYKIKYNGSHEEHRSSGVIISTGTGSPAWFYSAGGKVFDPEDEKLCFVVREPYFGKKVFTPKMLNGVIKKGEKLVIESTRHSDGAIVIQEEVYKFNAGDVVEIELSDYPLHTIIL